jgi:hypothetical protein
MSNTPTPGPIAPDGDDDAHADADAAPGRLCAVVVTYDGTADRRTVYPPEATETERLTHWLTADADAFVPLESSR